MTSFLAKLPQYWKFLVALLAPIGASINAAVTDDTITGNEWGTIVGAVVVALGVYGASNKAQRPDDAPAS